MIYRAIPLYPWIIRPQGLLRFRGSNLRPSPRRSSALPNERKVAKPQIQCIRFIFIIQFFSLVYRDHTTIHTSTVLTSARTNCSLTSFLFCGSPFDFRSFIVSLHLSRSSLIRMIQISHLWIFSVLSSSCLRFRLSSLEENKVKT